MDYVADILQSVTLYFVLWVLYTVNSDYFLKQH
jgi:hypothetical protein